MMEKVGLSYEVFIRFDNSGVHGLKTNILYAKIY